VLLVLEVFGAFRHAADHEVLRRAEADRVEASMRLRSSRSHADARAAGTFNLKRRVSMMLSRRRLGSGDGADGVAPARPTSPSAPAVTVARDRDTHDARPSAVAPLQRASAAPTAPPTTAVSVDSVTPARLLMPRRVSTRHSRVMSRSPMLP
jgi:hypothetical protein